MSSPTHTKRKLEALVDSHGPRALRLARSLTWCREDAEDVVGAAFLAAARKAVASASAIPSEENLWPWFAGVIVNEARNSRRREARRAMKDIPEDTPLNTVGAGDPEEAAADAELQRAAFAAMQELEDDQREALSLTVIEGLTLREGAAALGISHTALRKRREAGLAALRARLAVDSEDKLVRALGAAPLVSISSSLAAGWKTQIAQGLAQTTTSTGASVAAGISARMVLLAIAFLMVAGGSIWVGLTVISVDDEVAASLSGNAEINEQRESGARDNLGNTGEVAKGNSGQSGFNKEVPDTSSAKIEGDRFPENAKPGDESANTAPDHLELEGLGRVPLVPVDLEIRGRVVDSKGMAAVGATVQIEEGGQYDITISDPSITNYRLSGGLPGFSQKTKSDKEGRFHLKSSGLALKLEDTSVISTLTVSLFAVAANHAPSWRYLKVEGSGVIELGDIHLQGVSEIRGRVTNAYGEAIPGAMVELRKGGDEALESTNFSEPSGGSIQRSGGDGSFAFGGVTSGNWLLSASHSDYSRTLKFHDVTEGSAEVQIILRKGGSVTGHVTMPETTDLVRQQLYLDHLGMHRGRVIGVLREDDPMARIVSRGDIDTLALRSEIKTVPDSQGNYEINGVAPGRYYVVSFIYGFMFKVEGVEVLEDQESRVDISFDEAGEVHGQIFDEEGQPVAESEFRLVSNRTPSVVGKPGEFLTGMTDSNGEFRLTGVPPGTWSLALPREAGKLYNMQIMRDRYFRVPAGGAVRKDLRLGNSGGATIRGSVRVDGKPRYRFIRCNTTRLGAQYFAQLDAEGNFAIEGAVPGTYIYTFSALSRPEAQERTYSGTLEVKEGDDVIDLHLDLQSYELRGRVLTGSGESAAGRSIELYRTTAEGSRSWFSTRISTVSGSEGEFVISGLMPGYYSLRAIDANHAPVTKILHVDQDTNVDMTLGQPAGGLNIEVAALLGTETAGPKPPFEHGTMSLRSLDGEGGISFLYQGELNTSIRMDTLGEQTPTIALSGIAPGRYKLRAVGRHIETYEAELTVVAGQTTRHAMTLYRGPSVLFTFTFSDGNDKAARNLEVDADLPGYGERRWGGWQYKVDPESGRPSIFCDWLQPGKGSFTITCDGYETQEIEIDVQRATMHRREVTLVKKE